MKNFYKDTSVRIDLIDHNIIGCIMEKDHDNVSGMKDFILVPLHKDDGSPVIDVEDDYIAECRVLYRSVDDVSLLYRSIKSVVKTADQYIDILSIRVNPDYRDSGCGTLFMKSVIEIITSTEKEKGTTCIYAELFPHADEFDDFGEAEKDFSNIISRISEFFEKNKFIRMDKLAEYPVVIYIDNSISRDILNYYSDLTLELKKSIKSRDKIIKALTKSNTQVEE